MARLNGATAALLVAALLASASGEPIRISLKKGRLAPMASLRPSQVQGMLQNAYGGADVPIHNFLDAQVRVGRQRAYPQFSLRNSW